MSLKFQIDKFGNRTLTQANKVFELDAFIGYTFLYESAGVQTISLAGGIDGGAAVGNPALRQTISPAGIATTQALGTPALRMTISPSGVASTQAVGSPSLRQTISPAGVATTSATGTPALRMTVSPTGIGSSEAMGSPTIAILSGTQTISDAGGIDGGAAVGTPTLMGPVQTITDAGGVSSSEAIGEPTLTIAKPQPISTGAPRIRRRGKSPYFIDRSRAQEVMAPMVLSPAGVESDSAVGTPALIMMVSPAGADGDAQVGVPTVSFDYRRRNKRELELLLFEAA